MNALNDNEAHFKMVSIMLCECHLNKKIPLLGRRRNNLTEQTNGKHNILMCYKKYLSKISKVHTY